MEKKLTTGEKIKYLRLEQNLTQKALANKCGMYESQIRKYETGKANPKIETLQKIANALNVPLYELMEFNGSIQVNINKQRPFDIAIQKYQNDEKLTEKDEQAIIEYVKSDQLTKETGEIKQLAQKAYDYISYMHSNSYASSEEEFNKLQKERQIGSETKKHNNVHKYDDSIWVNMNPERERLDEEAAEIFKRQVSGEEITEEESQKVNDFIERTRESYVKLSEDIKNLAKELSEYLNENTQISKENYQILKEKLQTLTDLIPFMPNFYENLNDVGQQKAADYISDLSNIPEYRKEPKQKDEPPQE